jgi:ABC-type glycerol-3-phosphate transport system permease component
VAGDRPLGHLLMAASVATILPPIILFFAFQRYFVQGVALTGLKG